MIQYVGKSPGNPFAPGARQGGSIEFRVISNAALAHGRITDHFADEQLARSVEPGGRKVVRADGWLWRWLQRSARQGGWLADVRAGSLAAG